MKKEGKTAGFGVYRQRAGQKTAGYYRKTHLIQGISILYKFHNEFLEDKFMEKKKDPCYNELW